MLREIQQQALEDAECCLEAKLHAELHFAGIQSPGRLAKVANWLKVASRGAQGGVLVVRSSACGCKDEIRTIEYIEGIRIELHADPFGDFEDLGHGHIRKPVARTNKVIATHTTHAAQARRREGNAWGAGNNAWRAIYDFTRCCSS